MTTHHAVDAYLATWNARGEQRTKLIAEHWASDATYTDPLAEVAGHDALDALIGGVHEQFPGCVFTPVGAVDAHHRQLRFQWGLGPDGAEPLAVGFDVLILDEDGRIKDVRGFLDKVPGA
ncbi:nuclear transport factor 2 family protein [Streptomyces sp. SDT5-1]|uniref:nuclear transport factor 2 family protein n=1 Tax=Streptomyces sp. SDT5-1 TaxID=3406418 RepID=UPI003FD29BD3